MQATPKYLDRFADIKQEPRHTYAGMVSAMDDNVGLVLQAVREAGIEQHTLIFFLNDNGGPITHNAVNGSSNGPLRGGKAETWEGGIRVPLLAQWKGVLPAGKTYDQPVIQMDVSATALAAAGLELKPQWKLDGVNLLPFFLGQNRQAPHDALYWRLGGLMAIRSGDWKLVTPYAGLADMDPQPAGFDSFAKLRLFNVAQDIGENHPVGRDNPQIVAQLKAKWNAWASQNADSDERSGGRKDAGQAQAVCGKQDEVILCSLGKYLGGLVVGACWQLLYAPGGWTAQRAFEGLRPGCVYQGVGVSAGASTRLLYDYAEPYRGDVLDFLFKPNFGAGFQHLKVEIGGGENSTCGSEPSHAITREELAHPKARGYEFWLMKEARNRNPQVMLDCLPWSYPGWIRGRFSQDATDWFVAFLEVARKQYQMEVDWVSAAQNENGTDRNWIVNSLRPTLDARGFRAVKIQAPDCDKGFWQVFDEFEKDPAYRDAVEAVGYHYVNGREPWNIDQVSHRDTTPKARASGKQLWASEEWSMSGGTWDGTGAMFLARLINKLYIRDRICKTEIWCPIDSIYDGLPWSDTGAMQADTPWSGHYTVWPAVWAVAHTTQFARPGWKYLDGGCGQIDPKTWKGTYVTLERSPHGRLEHDRLHRWPDGP